MRRGLLSCAIARRARHRAAGWVRRLRAAAAPVLLAVLAGGAAAPWAAGASEPLAPSAPAPGGVGVVTLTQALAVADDAPAFPDGAAAVPRTLPDDGSQWRGDAAGPVWYRVVVDRPAWPVGVLPALYLPRACSRVEVQLNGRLVHRDGVAGSHDGAGCHRPQLVALPPALFEAGVNHIDLRVDGQPLARVAARRQAGGLAAPALGPIEALAPRHARAMALQVYAPQAASATLLLMGGFMFVLGWRHRAESHLAYFGALSVGWALVEAERWLPGLPLGPAVTASLVAVLLAFVTLAAVQFLLRYAGWRSARVGRLLALQCALMPVSLALAGAAHLHLAATLWTAVFAMQVAAAALFHLRLRRQAAGHWPRSAVGLLAFGGAALAVLLLDRVLAVPDAAAATARLAVPLALVVVGLRLMQQHGQALLASEASRAMLERRVQEAAAQIERSFHQVAALRVEQVTAQERKRIAGDLHDDLGAKLLTIVHTSDDPRISTLAREALEEMRLSVRGLTGRPMRLGDALADWRAELMGRLAQSGIAGEWLAPDDAPQVLPARAYVQTTRILREATNNIVKHSAASQCSFSAAVVDDDLQIVIHDNGRGIPAEVDQRLDRGHGLASMKQRAKQMRGQCLVESAPGHGTVIRLTLPLGETAPVNP